MTYIIQGNANAMDRALGEDADRTSALRGRSGGLHTHRKGGQAQLYVSDITGLEWLTELPSFSVTTYQEALGYKRQKTDENGKPLTVKRTIPAHKATVKQTVTKPAFEIDPETGEETTTPIMREDTDEQGNVIMVQATKRVVEEVEIDVPAQDVFDPDYEEVARDNGKHTTYKSVYDYDTPDADGKTRDRIAVVFNPKEAEFIL